MPGERAGERRVIDGRRVRRRETGRAEHRHAGPAGGIADVETARELGCGDVGRRERQEEGAEKEK